MGFGLIDPITTVKLLVLKMDISNTRKSTKVDESKVVHKKHGFSFSILRIKEKRIFVKNISAKDGLKKCVQH